MGFTLKTLWVTDYESCMGYGTVLPANEAKRYGMRVIGANGLKGL